MLKPFLFVFKKLREKKASHTVGLERKDKQDTRKTIATSHHPTRWAWNVYIPAPFLPPKETESPSHTVGSELWRNWEKRRLSFLPSPSHAVGLELRDPATRRGLRNYDGEGVTIPHGGLGTIK
jgi:hypothetical protein